MLDRQQDQWLEMEKKRPIQLGSIVAWIILLGALFLSGVGRAEEMPIPVQTLILEAENQGLNGMIAVGNVIRNRANKAKASFETICLAPYQFSAWNDRKWAKNRLKKASLDTVQLAYLAWELSETKKLVGESRHYHTKDVHPYWAKGETVDYAIGSHLFFEGVK